MLRMCPPCLLFACSRVPTPQEIQGKCPEKVVVKENTVNLKILPKHGILSSKVVNFPILKMKDFFSINFQIFSQKLYVCKARFAFETAANR